MSILADIGYGLMCVGILVIVLRLAARDTRRRRDGADRGRWVDDQRRFDDDHRLKREVHGQAMWDAVAKRERKDRVRAKDRPITYDW